MYRYGSPDSKPTEPQRIANQHKKANDNDSNKKLTPSHRSTTMRVSPREFANFARDMLDMPKGNRKRSPESERRNFRAALGASFKTISKLWNMLEPLEKISRRARPKHLLWTLVYLKVHKSEPIHCRITGCKSRDTFRNWVNRFVDAIADLEDKVIVFEHRFQDWDGTTRCLTCIDGTDIPIHEPGDRNSIWWSHKYNGPGVRYEVATCILTGDIVWFRGPIPCNMSDREIFDLFLSHKLIPGEGVEADNGYTGRTQIFTPSAGKTSCARKQKSQVRGRHENVNGLFKVFGAMKKWENPDTARHGVVARSVAVIVQLSFSVGEKLYNVPYTANYD
jgi:hypothetical protein